MSMVQVAVQKTQQLAQGSSGRSLDAVAFVGGIAVWQDWLPVVVGIFTCAWLGIQMFIAIPKMRQTWQQLKSWWRGA